MKQVLIVQVRRQINAQSPLVMTLVPAVKPSNQYYSLRNQQGLSDYKRDTGPLIPTKNMHCNFLARKFSVEGSPSMILLVAT